MSLSFLYPSIQPASSRVIMIHDVFIGLNCKGTSHSQDPGQKSALSRLLEIFSFAAWVWTETETVNNLERRQRG